MVKYPQMKFAAAVLLALLAHASVYAGARMVAPSLPEAVRLESCSFVQPGFIIGHPAAGGSGHVGIVDFDGEGIAAGAENVNRQYPHWKDGTSGFNKYNAVIQGGPQ